MDLNILFHTEHWFEFQTNFVIVMGLLHFLKVLTCNFEGELNPNFLQKEFSNFGILFLVKILDSLKVLTNRSFLHEFQHIFKFFTLGNEIFSESYQCFLLNAFVIKFQGFFIVSIIYKDQKVFSLQILFLLQLCEWVHDYGLLFLFLFKLNTRVPKPEVFKLQFGFDKGFFLFEIMLQYYFVRLINLLLLL